ncbi:MAG: outer membrane beta-barrel domain-containing protein [Bdellovibrionales bacterium]
MFLKWITILGIAFTLPLFAQQGSEDSGVDDFLYEAEDSADEKREGEFNLKDLKIEDVSGLRFLSPFKNVAMIQRKYLSKTERFELFPNIGVILNDSFFVNQILSFRAGYYFTEKWGLELNAFSSSVSNKKVTNDLQDRGVDSDLAVTPESFYGIDAKYTPVYGKMAFFEDSIIPFETYLTFGAGSTNTSSGESAPTAHFGFGQHFALSKSLTIRWDTSFFWYNATPKDSTESLNTNIHLTFGASFFFPEVDYR